MKRHPWIATFYCVFALALPGLKAQEATPGSPATPKKEKVTKLDGTSFFGIVTLTDDYTLKISNDSGILKIPVALLGESDFKKYGLQKDRSKDGRLWSERQDALESQDKEEEKTKGSQKSDSAIEIQLAEISVFQPVIAAYEAALGDKPKGEKSPSQNEEKPASEQEPSRKLFSGPGALGNFQLPFAGPGSSMAQPAISAGSSAVQSVSGVAPSLPVAP